MDAVKGKLYLGLSQNSYRMRQLFFLILLLFSSVLTFSQTTTYSPGELTVLTAVADKWAKYWNMHNMDSMGTLLAEEVDFINVAGIWLKGKKEVVQDHKQKHENFRFKTSIWETDSIRVKYIKPDLAIMHVIWGISGDFESENVPRSPRHGIFTWIVYKEKDEWLILSSQNTNIR